MHLLKSTQFWVLALCPKVCQHLPSDLEMFLCVSGTSKNVFGAWGPNRSWDIDTSSLPLCICSTVASFGSYHSAHMGVSTPLKWSRNVSICLKNLQKVFVALGLNRSWDIDLPSPRYLQLAHCYWALALCLQRCVNTSQVSLDNVSMCLRNFQKVFGVWGPNRSWDIDLHCSHHVFAQCGPVLSAVHSACGCVNTSQVVYKCSYMSLEPPKSIWCMGT